MGEALLPQIDSLKKQQIDDLKKLFAEVDSKIAEAGGKKEILKTRSEKMAAEEAAKEAAIDAAMAADEEVKGGEETKEPEADPLEFAPEVDLNDKFGPEW